MGKIFTWVTFMNAMLRKVNNFFQLLKLIFSNISMTHEPALV